MKEFNNSVPSKNFLTKSPCIHQMDFFFFFFFAKKLHARNICYNDRIYENKDL